MTLYFFILLLRQVNAVVIATISIIHAQNCVFLIINYVGMMINAGVNARNSLIKVYVINDLFGILVIVSLNVTNPMILVRIQTVKIVSAKKRLVNKLVEECTENVEETRLVETTSSENENKHKCSSCTLYIVLFSIFFTINVGIGSYFLCLYWYLKKDVICVKFCTHTQTRI